MWYHTKDEAKSPELKRKAKECLVREGRAHASLVFDGKDCVGWCQFGSPEELPRIHNERAYLTTNPTLPDWRITCFFFRQGLSRQGRCVCRIERCDRADQETWWWAHRGLSGRHQGSKSLAGISVQRSAIHFRKSRFQEVPTDRKAQVGGDPNRPLKQPRCMTRTRDKRTLKEHFMKGRYGSIPPFRDSRCHSRLTLESGQSRNGWRTQTRCTHVRKSRCSVPLNNSGDR